MTRARDLADSADKDIAGTLTLDDLSVSGTADVTGDLTVDTDTLYVDTTNDRVGIGHTNPQKKLEVWTGNTELSHFGSNNANASGSYTGISLGYAESGNQSYRKVGIVSAGTGDGAARQNLHFLLDTNSDGGSVDLGDTKMKIDYNGRVTMPYQPLFSASDTRSIVVSTNTVLTSSICFNTISYNTGNHFNSSNGRYTAPIDGYYDVTLHVSDNSSTGKNTNLRIRRNGVSNTGPLAEAYNQAGLGCTNVFVRAIIQCSAGDYIDFEAAVLNAQAGIQHKRFIIHLVG